MPLLCEYDVTDRSDTFQQNMSVTSTKQNGSDLSILCHTICSTRPGACVSADVSRTRFRASEVLRKSSVMVISPSSSSIGRSTRRLLLDGGDMCERGMRWRWDL